MNLKLTEKQKTQILETVKKNIVFDEDRENFMSMLFSSAENKNLLNEYRGLKNINNFDSLFKIFSYTFFYIFLIAEEKYKNDKTDLFLKSVYVAEKNMHKIFGLEDLPLKISLPLLNLLMEDNFIIKVKEEAFLKA